MVELIPRDVLFGNPERLSPKISPDGRQLAWVAPLDGVLNVWVTPVDTDASGSGVDFATARAVTSDTDRGIRTFMWAHDARHILYLRDRGGDENWRLYDVDLVSGHERDLTPFEGVQAQLLASHPNFPGEILVALNRDNPQLHDVYRLDLSTGKLEKEVPNPGFVDWLADAGLVVRAGMAPRPDGGLTIMVRDGAADEWRPLVEVDGDDSLTTQLVTVSEDGSSLLVATSQGADNARLVRVPTDGGAHDVLAGEEGADLSGARLHPVTLQPQFVTFLRERTVYQALDPAVAGDLARARAAHGGDMFVTGGDDGDNYWLLGFTNDSGPVPYYRFDRSTGQTHFLFEHQPELSRYQLAPMEPFELQARDGLTLHGYASFPLGEPRHGLPTVLNVHGGPWGRDVWGFDPTAQWLANRGYLCLQVNFRGSTGYGKAFVNAGDREWGGRMHTDLVDTVNHAIAEGWSDRSRVAIVGGSYGGYAALAGAAFTPDVFCCAVDIVGPSNLKTLIETIPPYWAPLVAQFHRRVGNPETDSEFLWSRSPLSRAADIRIPLLIAQGANDPRVKQAESEQIVEALRQAGIDHEYMLFPDEGHGFAKPENRLKFFAAAERFLAKHMGGRFED
jgi:dipeptidyl aminopeptidase/acylaminoacyl peptidase